MEHIIFGIVSLLFNGIEAILQFCIRDNYNYYAMGVKTPYTEEYPETWKLASRVMCVCSGIAFVGQIFALYFIRSSILSLISAVTMLLPVAIAVVVSSFVGKKCEKQAERQMEEERRKTEQAEQIGYLP